MSNSTFDRVRTRAVADPSVAGVDVQGKSALFSRDTVNPSLGSVVITCSDCHVATVASYARALQLALPSAAPAGPAPRLPVVDALPRVRRAPLGQGPLPLRSASSRPARPLGDDGSLKSRALPAG